MLTDLCGGLSVAGRFTCWEQYTNRRYANEGSRIDLVLVDEAWWASAGTTCALSVAAPQPLQGGDSGGSVVSDEHAKAKPAPRDGRKRKRELAVASAEYRSSLRACTADGRFQPALYDGSGIPAASPVGSATCSFTRHAC